jgi:biofilm PGA synthesis N-glycosyltransferase PgaC
MITAGLLLTAFYVLLIGIYAISWMMIPIKSTAKSGSLRHTYTILIPVRNEEQVIEKCLSDIFRQHFPASNFEVIVVNDYSTDETVFRVTNFIRDNQLPNLRLLHMADLPAKQQLKNLNRCRL